MVQTICMVLVWCKDGMGGLYGTCMVCGWSGLFGPYEENYFLKTKNFVWYADGLDGLYGV